MADEPVTPPPTNSNVQKTSEPSTLHRGEEVTVEKQLVQAATAALQGTVDDSFYINKPMTISLEQFKKAYDLLQEQIEDIVEPPSDRTAAFKQVHAMMKEAIKNVETTGRVQVIAITTTGVVVQKMSRLEMIRADTELANERLRKQAEEEAKNS